MSFASKECKRLEAHSRDYSIYYDTCFTYEETEFENDSANITTEPGLIGAIDGDDEGLAWILTLLDNHDVVARCSHTGKRRKRARNAAILKQRAQARLG